MTSVPEKIKVVWICSVSNRMLRKSLDLGRPWWHRAIRKVTRRNIDDIFIDTAQWNTNAIREFERIEDVDLHVIFVHPGMRKKIQRFTEGGIDFYAINQGDTSFCTYIRIHKRGGTPPYEKTWKRINKIVEDIKPDIIHLMGAENPPYSWSVINMSKNAPILVQLQTLTHNPLVLSSYPGIHPEYELPVIQRADYIGTGSKVFPDMIRQYIKKDPVIVNTSLLLAEKPSIDSVRKDFDFVYFSNNINKAIDLVIEAFAIAYRSLPNLTLDVIGGVSDSELLELKKRTSELGIEGSVTIEGKLPTHDDVINQIKKAKYALLPLKSDLISGTIREAIWAGLPVVTTITQGTPRLNSIRESVLLSETGDHDALAHNMLMLVNDTALCQRLRDNALVTVEEMYGNDSAKARFWVDAYHACINNFHFGTPIPEHILNNN